MGLFDAQEAELLERNQPLASRMRPRRLDEFVGQEHFLGEGKLLRRMLTADRIQSVILYGPPGTGKTTLAQLIAAHSNRTFRELNATLSGVKELREELKLASDRLVRSGRKTLLFVDELHRFSKSQQDVLLPDVERGSVCLIGATTANPFFALVAPLISRSQVFQFEPLTAAEIQALLKRAVADCQRGLGQLKLTLDQAACEFLANRCDGDARRALTGLEIAALSLPPGQQQITLAIAEESIQTKAIRYDANGDDHFDAASALIKSMRGSDPDAAVYWLARMLEAGEDPRFIARRLVIAAAEDVGNADPQALVVAMSAASAVEFVGLPEGRIILSQATTYIATAPKSNAAYRAIDAALDDVRNQNVLPVPRHLRDAHYPGAGRLGHGSGYQYSHDSPTGWVAQDYLGVDRTYYFPVDRGYERQIREFLENLKNSPAQDAAGSPGPADE